MKKNHDLHFSVEKDFKDKLKKEASELKIHVSELCRHKLHDSIPLTKARFLFENFLKELNDTQNLGKRSSKFCC